MANWITSSPKPTQSVNRLLALRPTQQKASTYNRIFTNILIPLSCLHPRRDILSLLYGTNRLSIYEEFGSPWRMYKLELILYIPYLSIPNVVGPSQRFQDSESSFRHQNVPNLLEPAQSSLFSSIIISIPLVPSNTIYNVRGVYRTGNSSDMKPTKIEFPVF